MVTTPPVPLPHTSGPLSGYRVLDLADEKGQLCARLLGELGADVIKVEPPGGDSTRGKGPFLKDTSPGPDTSLWWWTMNAGKRSITCDLKQEAGRALLRELLPQCDALIETAKPGVMQSLGLDYERLSALHPGLIMTSITGFGQTGPYAMLEAPDIVGAAIGGLMYLNGDQERGPVRVTAPQAYVQANVQAGVGTLIAIYARGVSGGVGQHVDASMQEAMANAMDHTQQIWDISGINYSRPGATRGNIRYVYQCADGWIAATRPLVGPNAGALIDWLADTGEDGGLNTPEWRAKLSTVQPLTEEEQQQVERTFAAFCRARRKDEVVAGGQARNAGWAPVYSSQDLVESDLLRERDYWLMVEHEDLGRSFIYPGAPFRLSLTPWAQRGRAPHIGEHNDHVYRGLLNKDAEDLSRLRAAGVI